MKPDRIKYGKSFRIGLQDIWERIDIEASIEPGESINACLDELKKEVEFSHRLLNPGLYEGMSYSAVPHYSSTPPVINREAEKIEIAIDNCTDAGELEALQNEAIKHGLVKQFIEKKKLISQIK